MGQKQYKLRTFTQYCWDTIADTHFKIAMCGDSVWFGYNTLKSTGVNDATNATNYYIGNANEKLTLSPIDKQIFNQMIKGTDYEKYIIKSVK